MASPSSTMKAVYLPGRRQTDIRTVDVPVPGYGQVLVQIRASTLCGSDLRVIYRAEDHKPSGGSDAEGYTGVIAGHEPCGVIVKCGEGVPERWTEGTRVIIYHIQGCGSCSHCRKGLYISCHDKRRKAYGWQRDGGHAEYLLADQQSLVYLPSPLTYLDGAIIACGLGTAYAACTRAALSGTDTVLITGMGPVGLGTALLAQKFGARVLGLELNPSRVSAAKKLGIECIPCSTSTSTSADKNANLEADVINVINWAGGELEGVDVAIDCSGNSSARLTCLKSARYFGRVVFVGEGGDVSFEVSPVVIHKSLSIYGSWVCSIGQMEDLVERMVRWDFHPEVTISNTFTIDEADEAYRLFDSGKSGKCAIVFQGEQKRYHV